MYKDYQRLYETAESKLYLQYDQFKDDTPEFIHRISMFLGLEVPKDIIDRLSREASPVRQGAPQLKHKRSGNSKQWETELKPETVEELNRKLHPILEYWNFLS